MKKILIAACIALSGYVCLFSSCEEETPGLSKEIQNIVPDSTLNKIISLGMPINKGTKPTTLTNIYKASPYVLKATNVPNDWTIGKVFSDYKVRLYDQDNDKLTIKLDYVNGPETGTGIGGFISGTDNNFSVFVKVRAMNSNTPADIIQIISGTITADGIKDFYFANFMLDDFGDPKNVWMDKERGRVIYDSDGISPVVSSLQSKSLLIEYGASSSRGNDIQTPK